MKKRLGLAGMALAVVLTLCWSTIAAGADKDSASVIKLTVHEYISSNAGTKSCLETSMQMVEDMYSGKRSYSAAAVSSQLETLTAYRSSIDTDSEQLLELENLYLQEYAVVKNALYYARNNSERPVTQGDKDCIKRLAAQADSLEKKENNAYVSLFQKAGMKYSIDQDGKISYDYSD
jgi:hypothetical protein